MFCKPRFQVAEETLATRVRHVQFFSVGIGSGLRDHLTPSNAVSLLRCFFPTRRAMIGWILREWASGVWSDFKWWRFWFWHKTVMRRNKSQIEVILDNKYREECSAEEVDGIEDFSFDEEEEAA